MFCKLFKKDLKKDLSWMWILFVSTIVGSSTGVENVVSPIINDNKRYNLLGTIVDENHPGIYILNGKKYMNR